MRRFALLAATALLLASWARAQPCTSAGWRHPFAEGIPSTGYPNTLVFDDDGPGLLPARLVCWAPDSWGGSHDVRSWDGSQWIAMNAGLEGSGSAHIYVYAMAQMRDASGHAVLYAAGAGNSDSFFAKWNGQRWVSLPVPAIGTGPCYDFLGISTMTAYDPDGAGPLGETLIATVSCENVPGFATSRLYQWDGATWSLLSSTVANGMPRSAVAYTPPGGSPAVVIECYSCYGVGCSIVETALVQWNGSSLSTLATTQVSQMAVLNDLPGGGSSLFVTGWFTNIGGVPAHGVARWDGQAWHAADAGLGTSSICGLLCVVDPDGDGPEGPRLLFGKCRSGGGSSIIVWNGSSWSDEITAFAGGAGLVSFDDGVRSVFAIGSFYVAGNVFANNAARTIGPLDVNGTNTVWAPVGHALNNAAYAAAAVPATQGSLERGVYAGGAFYTAGSSLAVSVARWDGAHWFPLSSGVNNHVQALTVGAIGGPASLFVGGKFTNAGGVPAAHIARWDGSWHALGSGLNERVEALTTFNGRLIAGGAFSGAMQHIASWDGNTWSALGAGTDGEVLSMVAFNDGSGDALYAGGSFLNPGSNIARWNGATWSPLGAVLDGPVRALAVYDDGTGPALFATGSFTHSGTTSTPYIAKWNGTVWTALGQGLNGEGDALAVFDSDGSGGQRPQLVVGGRFLTAGGISCSRVARWNGSTWSPLGSGANNGSVLAMVPANLDGTPSLFMGGEFSGTDGSSNMHMAEWHSCACYANCDSSSAPPILNAGDFQCFLNKFAAGDVYANCDQSTAPPLLNVNDFQCYLNLFAAGCP